MTKRIVLGVDGARGGWMVAEYDSDSGGLSTFFVETLDVLVPRLDDDVAVIAIDMPIGLPEVGPRPSDRLARERLGPRRSTFFPTPIRSVLDASTYAEANHVSKDRSSAGLSTQAWNLVPKIREVDAAWRSSWDDRLIEAHPELSFAELSGGPVMSKKATPDGRTERTALLRSAFGDQVVRAIDAQPAKWSVDAVDACALAWTADRARSNQAVVLGGDFDESGRPMKVSI